MSWKKNLFFVWLSQMLSLAGFGICMPFIPLLMRDVLRVEESMRGVYVSCYTFSGLFSLCIANALWGMLADRVGRKIMLLRASFGAAICYPLLCLAPDVHCLIALRFICSFFSGTVNPAQTLLVSTAPQDKHGFVLGTLSTATWSGNMLGYLSGGLIVHYFSYQAAFLTCGALYLLSGLLVLFFVREDFVRPAAKKNARKQIRLSWEMLSAGLISIFMLFSMMGASRRMEQPFIAMLAEIVGGNQNAAFNVGIVCACAAAGGVLSGVFIGWLCDRVSLPPLLLSLLALTSAGTILQAFAPGIAHLAILLFLTYFCGGGIEAILLTWLSRNTPTALKGTYFGLSASLSIAGGIASAILSGFVVYDFGVRGVYISGGCLTALMIPIVFIAIRHTRHASDTMTSPVNPDPGESLERRTTT